MKNNTGDNKYWISMVKEALIYSLKITSFLVGIHVIAIVTSAYSDNPENIYIFSTDMHWLAWTSAVFSWALAAYIAGYTSMYKKHQDSFEWQYQVKKYEIKIVHVNQDNIELNNQPEILH